MPDLEESSVGEYEDMLCHWREYIQEDYNTTVPPSEGTETTNIMPESNEETGDNNNIAPIIITLEDIKI